MSGAQRGVGEAVMVWNDVIGGICGPVNSTTLID